ncbi:hypothetical protein ACFO0N_18715 [Halobium salinum]|uniref:Uncharacterized protein n=1 Tax=Halobium salinum TaxID=1364940 RepID=A0ABD5PGS0_9EURY|nr:hypothetical protein [Halobium salinum]
MTPARPTDDERGDDREGKARVVEALRTAPKPAVNTGYLVKRIDRPHGEVFALLDRLADEGAVEHLEIRGVGHLWWLPSDPAG